MFRKKSIKVKVPRIKPKSGGIKMLRHGVEWYMALRCCLKHSMQMCRHHLAGKILKVQDHKLWRILDYYVQKAVMLII